ncbi:MAG TPA: 3-hydroxyacyl-CoA dehydrogenase NAD-binding domain-containing protein, partial [Vicinamibacteria bacterium]|nr:3-hydroxyacyl-CoA dehydrogenase NAD-binding domain-containing protein [Vicinamibacteria bacterium]
MTVNLEMRGGVAVLTINHPPVNALGAAVKRALLDHLDAALADDAVNAVVIAGAGKHFSAGADLREFGEAAAKGPLLPDLIDRLEKSPKPVVAALHGTVAGGALELALGCHYRIAEDGAELTLPEVALGILPGAGGTARLPRLVGVEAALDLILSGRRVGAPEAAALGLVDEAVARNTAREAAVAFAERVSRRSPRRTRDLAVAAPAPEVLARVEAGVKKTARGRKAPQAAFDCVKKAIGLPFDEALRLERGVFLDLLNRDESRALRHVFLAEREAQKAGELKKGTTVRAIRSVGVVGFGTMGGGIAMAFGNAGIPAVVIDETPEAVDLGLARVRATYEEAFARGRLTGEQCDERLASIRGATDYRELAEADLVIEAVFEEMEIKHKVFAKLDEVCSDKAILATNTSSLDVDAIAEETNDPSRVLGLHFFSPANVMKLVEVVRPATVSATILSSALDVVKRIGKIGVVVGVCDGFVGNRMLYAYRRQADFLLEEGALPAQVDKALREFGMAMGPFQVGDLAGLDIGWRVRKRQAATRPKDLRYSPIADRLCEMGRFGQKTGAGWYRYEKGGRTPLPDPEVEALVRSVSAELGFKRREIADGE